MPVLKGENPSPIEGVKQVGYDEKATKSDPTDISQQLENLKVEDASSGSTGCREFSSDREIAANERANEGTDLLPMFTKLQCFVSFHTYFGYFSVFTITPYHQ